LWLGFRPNSTERVYSTPSNPKCFGVERLERGEDGKEGKRREALRPGINSVVPLLSLL